MSSRFAEVAERLLAEARSALGRVRWRSSWELFVPIACAHALLVCLKEISPKEPLWADELLTRILTTDHSAANMLDAVADGVDGSPPAYWLTTWAWVKFAGATPYALRFLTTSWVIVALFASWATFRRRYGFYSASVATMTTYFLAPVLWRHAFEARHYGLLVASTAIMVLTTERLFDAEKKGAGRWIASAVANAVLVNTHLFGFFYSGCGLLAFAIADLRRGRFRWRMMLSFVAGWASFAPWLPSVRRQQKSTEWGYWAPVPTIDDLKSFNAFVQEMPLTKIMLVILAFGALALLFRAGRARSLRVANEQSTVTPAPIAGVLFLLLVPSIAWWLSVHRPTSVWVDRYMTPQFLGWTALVAFVLNRVGVDRPLGSAWPARLVRAAAMLLATLGLLRYLTDDVTENARARAKKTIAPLDTDGLPVAAEFSHRVLEQWFYAPQVDIYYILDANAAQRLGTGTAIDYKILSALGRHYPVKTIDIDAFLAKNSTFLHLETGSNWFMSSLGRTRGKGHVFMASGFRGNLTKVMRADPPPP